MKHTLSIICLLVLCGSLYLVGSSSRAATPQTWEYKVMVKKCNDEKTLNKLGAEGWELATYSTWALSSDHRLTTDYGPQIMQILTD